MSNETLIALEHGDGSPADLPPAFTAPPAEEAPEPAADATPETPAETSAPETETAEADEAPETADEPAAGHTVPLKTLVETRRQLAEAKRLLKEHDATIQAARALGAKLSLRPDLVAQLDGQVAPPPVPVTPPAPAGPPEHELRELAEELGLYTPENKPDLETARRVWSRTEKIASGAADRAVQQAVQPLRERIVTREAEAQRSVALNLAKEIGVSAEVAQVVVDGLMQNDPASLSSRPVLEAALYYARGIEARAKDAGYAVQVDGTAAPVKPAPAATPKPAPMHTEIAGGRASGPRPMSQLERDLSKQAGIKPEVWQQAQDRIAGHASRGASLIPMEEDE